MHICLYIYTHYLHCFTFSDWDSIAYVLLNIFAALGYGTINYHFKVAFYLWDSPAPVKCIAVNLLQLYIYIYPI